MKHCPKCGSNQNPGRGMLLAFKDGKPIYYCTRHADSVKKDSATDWIRLPKVRRIDD